MNVNATKVQQISNLTTIPFRRSQKQTRFQKKDLHGTGKQFGCCIKYRDAGSDFL